MTDTAPAMTPEQESALSKLSAGTHVLVPVEPTEAMMQAAIERLDNPTTDNPKADAWNAVIAYRAMITAAQEGE